MSRAGSTPYTIKDLHRARGRTKTGRLRAIVGALSLASFAVLLLLLFVLFTSRRIELPLALGTLVVFGLAVFFRALKARLH